MADITFEIGLGEVLLATLGALLTAAVLYLARRVKQVLDSTASRINKVDVLERKLKVLILVLGEQVTGFKDAWNRFAEVEGVELLDPPENPTDLAREFDAERRDRGQG